MRFTCDSICVFIVQLAHSKLQVVPKFIRSMSYNVAWPLYDMHRTVLEILWFNFISYCTCQSFGIENHSSQLMCSLCMVWLSSHDLRAHTACVKKTCRLFLSGSAINTFQFVSSEAGLFTCINARQTPLKKEVPEYRDSGGLRCG